jgi:hypothetical protein
MFSINLEERLIRSKQEQLTSNEDLVVLAEAQKILDESSEEDIKLLKEMGLDHSLKKKVVIDAKGQFAKNFDQTRVFTGGEIFALCAKYGLRFLPINMYKGEVDPALPKKVREFQATFNEVIKANKLDAGPPSYDEHRYWRDWQYEKEVQDMHRQYENRKGKPFKYNSFRICAPKESFELKERPMDPLMFYPLGDDNFYLVHKWGSDISVWNMIKHWKNRNGLNWFVYVMMVWFVPLVAIALFFLPDVIVTLNNVMFSAFISTICWVAVIFMFTDGDFFKGVLAKYTWMEEFEER